MRARTTPVNPGNPTDTKTKLVIVADSGRLKAYQLDDNPQFSRPRLQLIEDQQTDVTHHLSADVTDQAGRFRKEPAVPGALSDGENHNLDLERRQRAVRFLANRIGELMEQTHADGCYFAADSRINQPILDELAERTRAKIERNVPANLSKLPVREIIAQLCAQKAKFANAQRQTQRQVR